MQRRNILKAIAAGAAASGLSGHALAAAAGKRDTVVTRLDAGRWAQATHDRIQAVIARYGRGSRGYDGKRKPYAVFDWDNTCIMNDCEEALMLYQIDHLAYKLTPDEFAAVLRQGVPAGPFNKDYLNVDGKPVLLEDIAADVEADYRFLHAAYSGLAGSQSLDAVRQTEQFKDFRAKLYFMYVAICDSHPIEIGYKWIIYFYANMTPAELQKLAEASNDFNLGDALRKVRYESSRTLPGRAGVVATSHFHGIRISSEIANLMNTLRDNGIDVYVSTASIDDVVRVFAGLPKYGYGVPPENVIGLRLNMRDGRYTSQYRDGWHFNWGPGKTVGIRNELAAKKGYGPILVAGDSDGDAWMLKDFADTRISLVVNRLKKGPIGELSQLAAGSRGEAKARYLLQGRDENTGNWQPQEETLKIGATEKKLLA